MVAFAEPCHTEMSWGHPPKPPPSGQCHRQRARRPAAQLPRVTSSILVRRSEPPSTTAVRNALTRPGVSAGQPCNRGWLPVLSFLIAVCCYLLPPRRRGEPSKLQMYRQPNARARTPDPRTCARSFTSGAGQRASFVFFFYYFPRRRHEVAPLQGEPDRGPAWLVTHPVPCLSRGPTMFPKAPVLAGLLALVLPHFILFYSILLLLRIQSFVLSSRRQGALAHCKNLNGRAGSMYEYATCI